MRAYDVYITPYLRGQRTNALGITEQRTGKTRRILVRGTSKTSVVDELKKKYPTSMIHVLVHY